MISTYVYGTPSGFDLFEDVDAWKSYFLGFYVTRKGRRLMVNRKDDNTTVYSFLCYDMTDSGGRPDSAFFGCSVVTDDRSYCPDLKTLYGWFDLLVNKLIERGKLFYTNKKGKLQYEVTKFADARGEVEWLKGNLPNIFTKGTDLPKFFYPSAFSSENAGTVACFNVDTKTGKINEAFQKVNWIAISPVFKPDVITEEIKLGDYAKELVDFQKRLLQNLSEPDPISKIESLKKDIDKEIKKLHSARKLITEAEKSTYKGILEDYEDLINNSIPNIIKNLVKDPSPASGPTPDPEPFPEPDDDTEKTCGKCHRTLSIEYFPNSDANLCNDCSNNVTEKKCERCGKTLGIDKFANPEATICNDCQKKGSEKPVKKPDDKKPVPSKPDAQQREGLWIDKIKPVHLIILTIILFVGISFALIKSCGNRAHTVTTNDGTVVADSGRRGASLTVDETTIQSPVNIIVPSPGLPEINLPTVQESAQPAPALAKEVEKDKSPAPDSKESKPEAKPIKVNIVMQDIQNKNIKELEGISGKTTVKVPNGSAYIVVTSLNKHTISVIEPRGKTIKVSPTNNHKKSLDVPTFDFYITVGPDTIFFQIPKKDNNEVRIQDGF